MLNMVRIRSIVLRANNVYSANHDDPPTLTYRSSLMARASGNKSGGRGFGLAVSSSPGPWIDVFALPDKFNLAVTESDLDPQVRKMSITF